VCTQNNRKDTCNRCEYKELEKNLSGSESNGLNLESCNRYKHNNQQIKTDAGTAMDEREAFFRSMLETSPFGFCCMNSSGQILYVNKRYADTLNIIPSASVLPELYDILPLNIREKHLRLFEKCLQGFTLPFLEKSPLVQKPNLEYIYGVYKPILNATGAVEQIMMVGLDLTAQKEREKHLEELHNDATMRLREFAKTIPDIGFVATEDGLIIEMFGNKELRQKEVLVHNFKKIMCKQDSENLMEKIQYSLLHNTVQFGEFAIDTVTGKRTLEMRIVPMSYMTDGKKTVALHAIDVTDKNSAPHFLQLQYEQKRQREILNDLIEGRTAPSQLVLDQAWRVKLNLAQPFSFFLVMIKAWQGKPWDNCLDHQEGYPVLIEALTEILTAEMEAILWECREGIGVLCPLSTTVKDTKKHEISSAQHIQEIVSKHFPDASIVIGISEFHPDTLQNIPLLYAQACEAISLGQTMYPNQIVHHYLDLGIFQIFPLLSDREKVISFINRTIGKLLEYDKKKGTHLLLTMEKLLQLNNLKNVADEMFVHHKTIAFRKKRIEKILGLSMDTLDNKITLNTALKLHQLFYFEEKNSN
jgi:sugar diacid utilization regulator/PAS domain-containing protein